MLSVRLIISLDGVCVCVRARGGGGGVPAVLFWWVGVCVRARARAHSSQLSPTLKLRTARLKQWRRRRARLPDLRLDLKVAEMKHAPAVRSTVTPAIS